MLVLAPPLVQVCPQPPLTWQTGLLGAEQMCQSHRLQLLLQTEAVLHPEPRHVDGHRHLLHLIQPAGQLLQVQTLLHLNTQTQFTCSQMGCDAVQV